MVTIYKICFFNWNFLLGCSKAYALEIASLHPAQVLQITHKKGSLDFGCDADLVFLDEDLNVLSTWIAGELVYSAS